MSNSFPLQNEVMDIICSFLSRYDLCQLALTCHHLHSIALQWIYSDLSISNIWSHRSCDSMKLQLLKSLAKHPERAAYFKSSSFMVPNPHEWERSFPSGKEAQSYIEKIRLYQQQHTPPWMDYLSDSRNLRSYVMSAGEVHWALISTLKNIRTLVAQATDPLFAHVMYRSLQHHKKLTSVHLECTQYPAIMIEKVMPFFRLQYLKQLRVDSLEDMPGATAGDDSILPNSSSVEVLLLFKYPTLFEPSRVLSKPRKLRYLCYQVGIYNRVEFEEFVTSLLRHQRDCIQILDIRPTCVSDFDSTDEEVQGDVFVYENGALLADFPNLREVRISMEPWLPYTNEQALVQCLPQSLEVLCLTFCGFQSDVANKMRWALVNAKLGGMFPRLRALHVEVINRWWEETAVDDLKTICQQANVVFTCKRLDPE